MDQPPSAHQPIITNRLPIASNLTAKQATNSRYAKREKARVQGHVLLKEACAIKREISNGVYTQEQLDAKRALIGKKESVGRRKFAQSEEMVPMDFAVALEDILVNDLCVRKPDNTGGFVAPVLKAKFQADAAIIGRFISCKSSLPTLIISNDIMAAECSKSIPKAQWFINIFDISTKRVKH